MESGFHVGDHIVEIGGEIIYLLVSDIEDEDEEKS